VWGKVEGAVIEVLQTIGAWFGLVLMIAVFAAALAWLFLRNTDFSK
jgi:hypothetical protein